MRIISGTHRGRHIIPPRQFSARPTTDFAKENLFNVLANRIDFENVEVLDLFGGTGSISFEFASRGAQKIDTVEMNTFHHSFIQKTARDLNFQQIHAIRSNVFQFLNFCKATYDVIFADPPYDLRGIDTLPDIVFEKQLLKPEGFLVLEHSKDYDFSAHKNFTEHRAYGSVNFSFFK